MTADIEAINDRKINGDTTKDITRTGPNRVNPTGFEYADTVTRSVGYHPQIKQMRIQVENKSGGLGDALYCHYAPQNFSESYVADWQKVPITGPSSTPIVYRYGQPKEWSMKLLFNDLGAPVGRSENLLSTEKSINWLFSVMRPSGFGGGRAIDRGPNDPNASKTNNMRPPTLLVFLTKKWFRCVLSTMSINRLAIHPDTKETLRAEIDVTFLEYIESAT